MSFSSAKDDSQPANKLAAVNSPGARPDVFLGRGSKIVGTLTFTGVVELDGAVEGEIRSEGRLTIGEAGEINARIQGVEVVVRGKVVGDISASKKLVLQKPARIVGNVACSTLSVEEGVVIEGKISMTSASPSIAAK